LVAFAAAGPLWPIKSLLDRRTNGPVGSNPDAVALTFADGLHASGSRSPAWFTRKLEYGKYGI